MSRVVRVRSLFLAVGLVMLMPSGWGQSSESASIVGKVTDASGAAVPGVAIKVTSPALQVPQVTTVSDGEGNYKVLELPAPGVYAVTFELSGFQTLTHQGVVLSVGFAGRVDAVMTVGAVTQTISVTGSSPVVDTVNTSGGTTLQLPEIQNIPKGVGMEELFPMAAGVSVQGKPDVGDSNIANRTAIITYGVLLEPSIEVEGINITTAHDLDTSVYIDNYAIGEAQVTTAGNNADVGYPGMRMVVELKSGSNTFHGSVIGDYENPSFQANNVTPALAAEGVKFTSPLKSYNDFSADLGGRILTDKLWFYGGWSRQAANQGSFGIVSGPDAEGCWTCLDAPGAVLITRLPEYNMKYSYQMNPTTKIIGVWVHANKFLNGNGASATVPLLSSEYEHLPSNIWKVEVQKTLSPNLLIDGLGGFGGYHVINATAPGTDKAGNPSTEELKTGFYTGPYPAPTDKPQNSYEAKGAVTYIRSGHQFKFGTDFMFQEGDIKIVADKPSGNYLLQFSSGLPSQAVLYNFPVTPVNYLHAQSVFGIDSWKLKRVVLNYGLRWERYNTGYPAQSKPAGQFSEAATYPAKDLLTWTDVVPRVGAAWDVAGNGKTVVKGSFGMFGDTMGYNFANTFNPNSQLSTTYRWNGPCVATGFNNISYFPTPASGASCDISPTTLATFTPTSPSYISATGSTSEINNPNLKQNKTYEYTAKVERQLVPNMALTVGWVHHSEYYLSSSGESTTTSTANGVYILRPYSIYTVPVNVTDTLTGAPVTLYTYPKSYAGAAFNQQQLTNAPSSKPDGYNSIEAAVSKRYSKRWNALASFWITKNHEWIQAIVPTPNDAYYPIDNTWNWEARGSALYNLPWKLELSGFYRAQSGPPGQRTETFTNPNLLQGAVTVRMDPFGSHRGPMIQLTNMKLAKTITFREKYNLQFNFQVFNLFNGSSPTSTSYTTGPQYEHVTGIIAPRIARIGGQFSF